MTLDEFINFVESLEEGDRRYIEPRLIEVMDRINITQVVKLTTLYSRVTCKNPENWENPLNYMKIFEAMGDWCAEHCKGNFGAITVTNWAFELPADAMRFRLTWDRSNYDDLAL